MYSNESVTLTRDVDASVVPVGTKVTLLKGETAHITQSLGGAYTVVVNGNMFRIDGQNADALGKTVEQKAANTTGKARTLEEVEKESWTQMKTCYDPEIPVNIVDLGLVYSMEMKRLSGGNHSVDVKMTLTAPGCGMGGVIAGDAQQKLLSLDGVDEAVVEIVWDPPWHQSMITAEGRRILGLE